VYSCIKERKKINSKKTVYYEALRIGRIFLQAICVIIVSSWYVTEAFGGCPITSIVYWCADDVEKNADLVMTAKLKAVKAPYEVLGKKFYTIETEDLLKGEITKNSLLVTDTVSDSSEGPAPTIESAVSYVLFLKQIENSKTGINDYKLVDNWKGIISLDRSASEKRSVKAIERQHGVNIQNSPSDFIDVIRCVIRGEPDKNISESALGMYESLGLRKQK